MNTENEKIEKVFRDNRTTVPIVFATDKNFVPYLYVAMQSLVDNTSIENNYDIVILYTDVEQHRLDAFKNFATNNISIRFYNVEKLMSRQKYWHTSGSYTSAVYYRFFIPMLFRDYDKVLHLDGDVVFLTDVAELYNIDLGSDWIGAVAGLGLYHKKSPLYSYVPKVLKIKREEYFNAGIMVLNISKLLEFDFLETCLSVLKQLKNPKFNDQDVLNIVCNGSIKYLHPTYNLTWNAINFYKYPEKYLPAEKYKELVEAMESPKILHYCGAYKPWKMPQLRFADCFWKYARKTPYYEEFLYANMCYSNSFNKRIQNVLSRKKLYVEYNICKFLKGITFGEKRNYYSQRIRSLKNKVKDYREVFNA